MASRPKGPDPALLAAQRRERQELKEQQAQMKREATEELKARRRGLRGRQSLIATSEAGVTNKLG